MNTSSIKNHLLLGALALATVASHASIINVTGAGDILSAGPGVGYTGNFFQDTNLLIHGWDEVQSFQLTANLAVDITTYGNFLSPGSLTPGLIPAGTVVNSHAFYFDPAGSGSAVARFDFDGTVIGVIVDDMAIPTDPFVASDFLIPGVVPAGNIPGSHFNARGLELAANSDHLIVGPNFVSLFLSAGSPGDQVRVLTLVPEPSVAGLLLLSGIAFLKTRRNLRTS